MNSSPKKLDAKKSSSSSSSIGGAGGGHGSGSSSQGVDFTSAFDVGQLRLREQLDAGAQREIDQREREEERERKVAMKVIAGEAVQDHMDEEAAAARVDTAEAVALRSWIIRKRTKWAQDMRRQKGLPVEFPSC